MAIITFTPPVNPSQDSSLVKQPNVLSISFGDGYSQRAAQGINNNPAKFDWSWSGLDQTDADAIFNFFEARAGHEAFYYTPPFEITARKFICTNYSKMFSEGVGFFGLRASFLEVFDLDDPDDTVVFDGGFFDPASLNGNLGTLDGGFFGDGSFVLPLTVDGGIF